MDKDDLHRKVQIEGLSSVRLDHSLSIMNSRWLFDLARNQVQNKIHHNS